MRYTSIFTALACIFLSASVALTQVSVNSSGNPPHEDAMLDVSSSTKGFLPPRMTTAERDAILTPPAGLMIYNLDTDCANMFNGTFWMALCGECQPTVGVPTLQASTNISTTGFTLNWLPGSNATSYRLDVSTQNNFSSFVSGYQDLTLGNVNSQSVSGLSSATT
jgi:hypothetical protein